MRKLFIHTGGIGDFLVSCPALAAWSEGHAVTLAGHRDRLNLAVAAGLAAEAVDLDAIDFASLFSAPSARLRAFLGNYDEVVAWMRDDDGTIARGLRECGVARAHCFPGLPAADWRGHASAYYLQRLGLARRERFQLSIAPEASFHGWVIHPGSGSKRKNWPVAGFQAVAEGLATQGHTVHWCVGPAEEDVETPAGTVALRAGALVDLARCLAGADGYVGNDSGITHLAAMVGCPTTAIFGPTDPEVWAPPGARVVQGAPWPTVEEVLAAMG